MPYPLAGEYYRDHPITESSVAIIKAGDGLSNALEVDPLGFEPEEVSVYMVEVGTEEVTHKAVSPGSPNLRQKHRRPVLRIAMVDDPSRSCVPNRVLDKEMRRVDKALQERRGQTELPDVGDGDGITDDGWEDPGE